MDYRKGSALLYGTIARGYDRMDRMLFRDPARNPRLALARAVPAECRSAIDLCAGTGASALAIARGRPGARVVGIDLSPAMLAVAARKAEAAGLSNLELREMDATAVGYPDASFDAVTTSLSLHEFPPALRAAALREMRRLVAPGGLIVILEWERPAAGPARRLFSFFPGAFEPRGFRDFLDLDWREYLRAFGFKLEREESCSFTKLVVARPA